MLFYYKITESEEIDNSEGTDVVRDSGVFSSNQCEICHFYFFESRNFNYQPYVCNECHGASLGAQSLTDFKIATIKKGTYRVVSNISYNENTRSPETSGLTEKSWLFVTKSLTAIS